jgi:hypothetical protein
VPAGLAAVTALHECSINACSIAVGPAASMITGTATWAAAAAL